MAPDCESMMEATSQSQTDRRRMGCARCCGLVGWWWYVLPQPSRPAHDD